MSLQRVFTPEEISKHLRVPEDAILNEISAGRLKALRIGDYIRVRESDFGTYLDSDSTQATMPLPALATSEARKTDVFELNPTGSFDHAWPAEKGAARMIEHFTDAHEGIVSDGDREYHIKLGFTHRDSAGKSRLRCLVFVDRYPTVEFVAADKEPKGKMASIIRDHNGKQLPTGATLPVEYGGLPVGAYQDVVNGPRASNGVAVICEPNDFTTMIRHALIRTRFRRAR